MCVSIINGEISNHTIQEKEPPKNKEKDSTVISAVILRGCIQLEMEQITIPKIQNILGGISNKLPTNPVTRSVAEEIEKHDFANIDDLNNHLQGFMAKQNTTPDPEMGGLSPEQVTRLIYSKWDYENFPLKFSAELEMSDL